MRLSLRGHNLSLECPISKLKHAFCSALSDGMFRSGSFYGAKSANLCLCALAFGFSPILDTVFERPCIT